MGSANFDVLAYGGMSDSPMSDAQMDHRYLLARWPAIKDAEGRMVGAGELVALMRSVN